MRHLLLPVAVILLCLDGAVTDQFSQCVCVMTQKLNVRAGPGTGYQILGQVRILHEAMLLVTLYIIYQPGQAGGSGVGEVCGFLFPAAI